MKKFGFVMRRGEREQKLICVAVRISQQSEYARIGHLAYASM